MNLTVASPYFFVQAVTATGNKDDAETAKQESLH